MADPKSVWISDAQGNKASVDAAALDIYKPRGWAESAQPGPADMVWLQHELTGGRALFAASVVPVWAQLGWVPAGPPEPVDMLHDPELVDVKEEPRASDVAPKKAASGSKKEQ